ncbi:MAG TPA: HAMP domain-containing sensor histidine kinase [Anaerolineales bacterium]|nr:HAMP domain-containing sensor histidine kinase [Anaerolineales bacterium]
MEEVIHRNWRQSVPMRFAIGVLGIVALSLLIFNLLMRPAFIDFGLMALFLSITALVSGLAGYGSYRLGWMQRSPTIRWTLLGGYLLSSVLTFMNVWVTARLMFFDQHDLLLATVLLLFAAGMAMALGYFLSSTLTDRIRLLDRAARSIASGHLDTRLPVSGKDELAMLATTFNQMASQLQDAARKKEELEALRRDLIAWAGHDLQTPLASIQAILEALSDGIVEEPETAQRYLHTAQRDIRSLSALIDDLFQMAQLDAGGLQLNLENNSLSDLISDTLESFTEMAARQRVTLSGSTTAEVDPVLMDAQRVGRVLNNLVSNALRHTPAGGNVDVQASRTPAGVQVDVTDTGEGIPAADLPNIFERFYRGEKSRSRSTGGSGLGLAIAKGIVKAHEGEIRVESQPGKTRFTFLLPDIV